MSKLRSRWEKIAFLLKHALAPSPMKAVKSALGKGLAPRPSAGAIQKIIPARPPIHGGGAKVMSVKTPSASKIPKPKAPAAIPAQPTASAPIKQKPGHNEMN